jgi:hypothetical protein
MKKEVTCFSGANSMFNKTVLQERANKVALREEIVRTA